MPLREITMRGVQGFVVLLRVVVHQHQLPRRGVGIGFVQQFAMAGEAGLDVAAVDQRRRQHRARRACLRPQRECPLAPVQRLAERSLSVQGLGEGQHAGVVLRVALRARTQQFRALPLRIGGGEIAERAAEFAAGVEQGRIERDGERLVRPALLQQGADQRAAREQLPRFAPEHVGEFAGRFGGALAEEQGEAEQQMRRHARRMQCEGYACGDDRVGRLAGGEQALAAPERVGDAGLHRGEGGDSITRGR